MANTYLTKTFSSSQTNAKKGTISFWFKLAANDSSNSFYRLFATGADTVNRSDININHPVTSTGVLNIVYFNTSSQEDTLTTNRTFRDFNAWYHLVIAYDTTQSTASNRIKVYVNGVQETSFSTENYPEQNDNLHFGNNSSAHHIGNSPHYNPRFFSGAMSHFHYCDGYTYAASDFGSTDATTGEWKINTSPNVQYGTNGFFILKDGNSVTDQSGNGNNFTVSGGTLTKTEDCPSNVFATINVLGRQAAGYTIENGNLSTNGNGSNVWRGLYGTIGASSGKFYYEFKLNTTYSNSGNSIEVGVADAETMIQITSSNGRIANAARGYAYEQGGTKRNNGTSTTYGNRINVGDIVGVAVDLDNSKLYFHRNGTYENSGDPTSGSTGTGAISIASGYTYLPAFSTYYSADDIQLNFGNGYFGTTAVSSAGTKASGIGIFEYDVPKGYTALSTKGLNE